ncbi:MAG: phage major capsid protein [Acidimicrobiia bacterium]
MSATTTTAANALKDVYLPVIREQLNNSVEFLRQAATNTHDIEGKNAVLSLHTKRNSGVGARNPEGGTLPEAGSQAYAEQRIPVYAMYGRIKISGILIETMKSDKGSFARALESETKGITADVQRDYNRQLWGTSNGVIATVASESAGVITLNSDTTTTQLRQLEVGMKIDMGTVADPTLRGTALVIDSISRSTPSITVTGTISGTPTTTDFIFRNGSGGIAGGVGQKEITGVPTIVNDSGTLHNVNPTNDPIWVSEVNANGGTDQATTDTLFEILLDDVRHEGGSEIDQIWVGSGVKRNYNAQIKTLRRFDNTVEIKGGAKMPTVDVGRGEVALIDERDVPEGQAFCLTMAHMIEFVLSDWDFMDMDGNVLKFVDNEDAYQAVLRTYRELATDKRNAHGRQDDLETTG